VEVTLGRGKKAQVLTRQEAGWVRGTVLKIERKENSLSLARNKHQFHLHPAIHFVVSLTGLVSSYYIKASRTLKIVLLRAIKFHMTITQYFLSYGF
jgi:hypothetical protein